MSLLKDRIEECMRRRPDLTQAEIARACKVKTPSVSDWLNGKTKTLKPEPARLGAALFGCDQNWLATGVGLPNWTDEPTPPVVQPITLRGALDVLGTHLAVDLAPEVRAEVADALSAWAKWNGKQNYRDAVEALLNAAPRSAAAGEASATRASSPAPPNIAAHRSKVRLPGGKTEASGPAQTPPGVVPRES